MILVLVVLLIMACYTKIKVTDFKIVPPDVLKSLCI